MSEYDETASQFEGFCEDRDRQVQQRISEHLKAPTYRDEVRSNLLKRMKAWNPEKANQPVTPRAFLPYLVDASRAAVVDFLLDEVMASVEHAVQISRVERGVLPYDED